MFRIKTVVVVLAVFLFASRANAGLDPNTFSDPDIKQAGKILQALYNLYKVSTADYSKIYAQHEAIISQINGMQDELSYRVEMLKLFPALSCAETADDDLLFLDETVDDPDISDADYAYWLFEAQLDATHCEAHFNSSLVPSSSLWGLSADQAGEAFFRNYPLMLLTLEFNWEHSVKNSSEYWSWIQIIRNSMNQAITICKNIKTLTTPKCVWLHTNPPWGEPMEYMCRCQAATGQIVDSEWVGNINGTFGTQIKTQTTNKAGSYSTYVLAINFMEQLAALVKLLPVQPLA